MVNGTRGSAVIGEIIVPDFTPCPAAPHPDFSSRLGRPRYVSASRGSRCSAQLPIWPRVAGIDRPGGRSRRGTIASRRGSAQWQSQRKRIQRDTERGRRRKRAEGWHAEGTETSDRRRKRERKREERESVGNRDPNNPSRSEESRVGRAVGSCATALRALSLSLSTFETSWKNFSLSFPFSTSFLYPRNWRRKVEAFPFCCLEQKAKVRAIVRSYVFVYVYRRALSSKGEGGWTEHAVGKSIGKTGRGGKRRGRIARKNRMIKRPRYGSRCARSGVVACTADVVTF